MKFNEKLMKLRKEKGLSQEEFGNLLDVSRQSVSKWELGQAQPDVDKIKKICEFYNISFDYLLNDNIDENEKVKLEELSKNIEKISGRVETKKSNKLIIIFQFILFIILFVYIMSCVFKAIVFFNIIARNDINNIESYKYNVYSEKTQIYNETLNKYVYVDVNEYVCYKNDMLYTKYSYTDSEEHCIYIDEYWNYYNGRFDKKGYNMKTKVKDGNWTVYEYFYTDEGNISVDDTSFEIVYDEVKDELSISNILNPFKFYKVTYDGDIVFVKYYDKNKKYSKYSKELYYIDISTGFLVKEERISNDELVSKVIYAGYEINSVEDKDLNFDDEKKNTIINEDSISKKAALERLKEEKDVEFQE
ncbi:MAG: helix-turn-helix transcriptional regulator [Clostridia bacterium]|nr:helix-turn-helix transcriptional regulator [Clostridia bacterium]